MQDALARRLRWEPPQPTGRRVKLTPIDLEVFSAIHRHGPLPSNYLFAFTGYKYYHSFQERLLILYNEGYLTRPPEYFDSIYHNSNFVVYDLTERTKELLQEQGLYAEVNERHDHMLHRLMGACIGASIELVCKEKGYIYVPRAKVVSELKLRTLNGHIEPDDVFSIRANGKRFNYAVEYDRTNEQLKKTPRKENLEEKHEFYQYALATRTFEDWGIRNLHVIFFTTAKGREEILRKKFTDPHFHFSTYTVFGNRYEHWRVPKTILTDVLDFLGVA